MTDVYMNHVPLSELFASLGMNKVHQSVLTNAFEQNPIYNYNKCKDIQAPYFIDLFKMKQEYPLRKSNSNSSFTSQHLKENETEKKESNLIFEMCCLMSSHAATATLRGEERKSYLRKFKQELLKETTVFESRKLKPIQRNKIIFSLNSEEVVPINTVQDYWVIFFGLFFKANIIVVCDNRILHYFMVEDKDESGTILINATTNTQVSNTTRMTFIKAKDTIINECVVCPNDFLKHFSLQEIHRLANGLSINMYHTINDTGKLKKKTKNELTTEIVKKFDT